jgi:hypothetical protein
VVGVQALLIVLIELPSVGFRSAFSRDIRVGDVENSGGMERSCRMLIFALFLMANEAVSGM